MNNTFICFPTLCKFFIICLYMYCHWRSIYQEGRMGIPLTGLILPHFCARPRFPTSCVMVFLCYKMKVVCSFFDIGGIGNHPFHNST